MSLLLRQDKTPFPQPREGLNAPATHGVYVIWSPRGNPLHVGRTLRGKAGLRQRLKNHLHAQSSFTNDYLKRRGSLLRRGYTFQVLEIPNDRMRLLVEYAATVKLAPRHLGLGLARLGQDTRDG